MVCVHSKESNVIPHVVEIMKKYPHVDAKLYAGNQFIFLCFDMEVFIWQCV